MARALSRHMSIHALPEEIHFFEQHWDPMDPSHVGDPVDFCAHLLAVARDGRLSRSDPRAYRNEADALLEGMPHELWSDPAKYAPWICQRVLHQEASESDAAIPCEHTPRNVFFVSEILSLFPEAKLICMVRDPRDVVLSQRAKWRWWRRQSNSGPSRREMFRSLLAYHPVTVALLWKGAVAAVQRHADEARVLTVRFETLVEEPEETLASVCEFLGVPWEPALLTVEQQESSMLRDSGAIGMNAGRAGAWRRAGARERADLFLCELVCRRQMRAMGYETSFARPPFGYLAVQLLSLPVRACLAVLMNVRRVRSMRRAVQIRLGRPKAAAGVCRADSTGAPVT
jgi:omega-hydroxy-beta-dihydromenaquinone-9 sulfotransferase